MLNLCKKPFKAKDVRFKKTVAISPNGSDSDGDGVNIFFDHSVQLDFTCRYTLANVVTRTTQDVIGNDEVYNREAVGTFSYEMVSYCYCLLCLK